MTRVDAMLDFEFKQGCLLDKICFRNGHVGGVVGLADGGGGDTYITYTL